MPDYSTNAFKVGDRVTIHTGQSGPQSLATVEKFTHTGRCMVLSDGSEWRADGKRQWSFRGSFYKGPFVEPTRDEDGHHVAKRRAIGAIRKWADGLNLDSPLSDEALRRILDLIKAEKAAVQAARED
jgi:hypothetical protein